MIITPIRDLFSDIFSFLLTLGTGIIIALLIYLGLQYTFGGAKEADKLKKWLPWLIGALVVIFLAEFIPVLLRTFFE